MEHKIVCWGDYAIPVPVEAKWMAFDSDGWLYAYGREPSYSYGCWGSSSLIWRIDPGLTDIIPPEPGPSSEQLYWIGD